MRGSGAGVWSLYVKVSYVADFKLHRVMHYDQCLLGQKGRERWVLYILLGFFAQGQALSARLGYSAVLKHSHPLS